MITMGTGGGFGGGSALGGGLGRGAAAAGGTWLLDETRIANAITKAHAMGTPITSASFCFDVITIASVGTIGAIAMGSCEMRIPPPRSCAELVGAGGITRADDIGGMSMSGDDPGGTGIGRTPSRGRRCVGTRIGRF